MYGPRDYYTGEEPHAAVILVQYMHVLPYSVP